MRGKWAGHIAHMVEVEENVCRILVQKPEGEIGRPNCR
jgi:hypothetical protein